MFLPATLLSPPNAFPPPLPFTPVHQRKTTKTQQGFSDPNPQWTRPARNPQKDVVLRRVVASTRSTEPFWLCCFFLVFLLGEGFRKKRRRSAHKGKERFFVFGGKEPPTLAPLERRRRSSFVVFACCALEVFYCCVSFFLFYENRRDGEKGRPTVCIAVCVPQSVPRYETMLGLCK